MASTTTPPSTVTTSPPPATDYLKLFGTWSSSYTHRVQLALKLKGLPYDYAEEDLSNKSPELLLYNPVYKKVPVLLHAGRPVAESPVILQYLDEAWPGTYQLAPQDPYDRAVARFWCHFVDDKLGPAVGEVFKSTGLQQQQAILQVHANLTVLEAELREGAFKSRRFFGGDRIGLLDVVLGCGSYWLWALEEVEDVRLVDPEAFPLFSAWLRDFEAQEEIRDIIPPADRLLEYARALRQMILTYAAAADAAAGTTTQMPGPDGVERKDAGAVTTTAAAEPATTAAAPAAADQAVAVGGGGGSRD